jgi:hypothetical protein
MIPGAKLKSNLAIGRVQPSRGVNIGELVFILWAVGVSVFWIGSSPESAPQQATLAGQALVLICVPYCVLSVLQRSRAARGAKDLETGESE